MLTDVYKKIIFEPLWNEDCKNDWLHVFTCKRFGNLCQEIEYKKFGTHTTEAETSFEIEAWNWI